MSACPRFDRYVDGGLSEADRREFESHLPGCAICTRQLAAWRAVERELVDWHEAPLSEPSDLSAARLVARARRRARSLPRSRRGWVPPAVAAGLAAVLAGLALWKAVFVPPAPAPVARPAVPEARGLTLTFLDPPTPSFGDSSARGAVLSAGDTRRLLAQIGVDLVGVAPQGRVRIDRAETIDRADSDETRLTLIAGTLAAEVRPRPAEKLFVVAAGGCEVRVKGTRLGVSRDATGRVSVALDSGHVLVDVGGKEIALDPGWVLRSSCDGTASISLMSDDERQVVRDLVAAGRGRVVEDSALPTTPRARTTPVAGRTTELPSAALFDRWRRWILEGKLDVAETELGAYLRKVPDDPEARSLIADCQRRAGKYAAAVASYRDVMRDGDGSRANRARYLAAVLLQERLADHRAASALLRTYLQQPDAMPALAAMARVRLGRSLLALGQKAEALPLLREVIGQDEGSAAAREARALLDRAVGAKARGPALPGRDGEP